MPVKWLLHWQPNPGATLSSQILTEACACVESVGGARAGRWKTTLTFYRPMARDGASAAESPRDFLGVQLHDHPGKYYFILRAHRILLESDSSIQAVMEKLQSYKARVVLNFEGFQYQLGDFQIRVEYLPLSSIEKSRQLMEEFVEIWQETVSKKSLPGHFLHIESNFTDYGLHDYYTPQHTAVQYATCMQQLIAAVRN